MSTTESGSQAERLLTVRFRAAAAMSLAMTCRLDAEPEFKEFLDAVKAHPDQREFVVRMFLDSFTDSFVMRTVPMDLIMYCMSDLRWPEIREFLLHERDEDIRKHGRLCYHAWTDLLESFEDDWRDKYFTDFTNMPAEEVRKLFRKAPSEGRLNPKAETEGTR